MGRTRRLLQLLPALLAGLAWMSASHGDIRVSDSQGRLVTLAQPAQRVVSLAPHITESLFAIGAGDKVVATVTYSDYPAAARAIPVVGSFDRVNLEALVAAKPDLVIAWPSGNPGDTVSRIAALGIPVYSSDPTSLDAIGTALHDMTLLTGSEKTGLAVAADFRQRLDTLRNQYADAEPVTVFYQVWHQPLLTLNGQHLVSDVLRLCGGRNIFADAPALVPTLNIEALLSLDPQVIVASGADDKRPPWLDHWRDWPGLQAVQHDHLYAIPPSLLQRHSPRILDGAEQLCKLLDQSRRSAPLTPQRQPDN